MEDILAEETTDLIDPLFCNGTDIYRRCCRVQLNRYIKPFNLLKATGHVMHKQFNLLRSTGYVMHQQFNLLKPTGHVMHQHFNPLMPTCHVMHQQFNVQQL